MLQSAVLREILGAEAELTNGAEEMRHQTAQWAIYWEVYIRELRTGLTFWRAFSLMAWSRSSEEGSWWATPSQKLNHGFQPEERK